MSAVKRRQSFTIGDLELAAGRAGSGELPVARLVTGNRISIPVRVVHGRTDGPTVWLSAAVHGDEVAGVEIIRRTLAALDPRALNGTVIAVPIVNVHGFLNGDRYLPDRRDLNRSFPGSPNGSLAGRIANLFMSEIVQRCDVGIDLHTGSDHRTNHPQIRADLDDPETRDLAIAFGAPLMLHAKLRDGSMRAAATAAGATMLLFEGGEAWRFDEHALSVGTRGVSRVLHRLGMDNGTEPEQLDPPLESRSSSWVRARRSGISSLHVALGDAVAKGAPVTTIHDSVGKRLSVTRAHRSGVVIGHTQHPLVNQGDAIVHIAEITDAADPPAGPARTKDTP
ncbi:MAG: succinylglutamate desuccinylase/aspartoacylase family protein [Ilumatobacter sp.]|nr:succinylglutamate desuccinylase/aspartoacylase family protein [Ilumatobacter sp.]